MTSRLESERHYTLVSHTSQRGASPDILFQVDNLDCADCALHLEQALSSMPDIAEAHVDFMRARLRIVPRDGADIVSSIQARAQTLGYPLRTAASARALETSSASPASRLRTHRRDIATAASGILILLAEIIRWLGGPAWAVNGLLFASILSGGYFVARSAWGNLRATHSFDMNSLMTVAALGAVVIGEWVEGAVVMFLFLLGNALELYTMNRARNAISSVIDLSPKTATLVRGDQREQVTVESLMVGDTILVRPGERIGMDGIIEGGDSSVNQAPVTGESIPVEKVAGDMVFAGTLNGQGALTIKVTRLAADNTIARIIRLVEEAEAQRAPSQRFVDTFARYYTPVVVAVAAAVAVFPPLLGIGDWSTWLYRGLVLLVIGCPCALVISTPVSIVAAIASAARAGVLIKGGAYVEELGGSGRWYSTRQAR